jgi:hypothetical protein
MTSRRAHPAVTFFGDAHFEIIQFVCAVSQFILSLSVQGSFLFIGSLSVLFRFRFQFHFRFSFVSFAVFVSSFFRVFIVESLCQPVLGRLESHMLAPKF